MYIVSNMKYMQENQLKFDTFMEAFKYQQRNAPAKKIFETKGHSTKRLTKVWDPLWCNITFYYDDPICPITKK